MCLIRPTDKKPTTTGIGYKIFDRSLTHPKKLDSFFGYGNNYPIKRWLKAKRRRINYENWGEGTYFSGFHIFRDRPRLKTNVYLVKYRKARIVGIDTTIEYSTATIVADEMLIIGPATEELEKQYCK